MIKHKALENKRITRESGNAVIIVLVVLVVAAVGALAYMSGQMAGDKGEGASSSTTAASAPAQQTAQAEPQEETIIKPGNPVVAKVGSEDITRAEVFNFIQSLPDETKQLPIGQLFPAAMEQVINARVIRTKTQGVNLDSDPEVQRQLGIAKENIVRNIYVQNTVAERVTEERMQQAYEAYTTSFPDVDEVKARHILVEDKGLAKSLIKKLDSGEDFAALAKENSIDGTAQNGGELGYFARADVVPAFSEAAFATEPGFYTKSPVETEFGFHIIEVQEKRKRPPATLEQARPFLEAQLRRLFLDQVVQEWRQETEITRFDINGEAIEPAAGTLAPEAPAAPEATPPAAP